MIAARIGSSLKEHQREEITYILSVWIRGFTLQKHLYARTVHGYLDRQFRFEINNVLRTFPSRDRRLLFLVYKVEHIATYL